MCCEMDWEASWFNNKFNNKRFQGQAPVQQQAQCRKSKNSRNTIYWNNRYDLKGSGLLGLQLTTQLMLIPGCRGEPSV